MYESWSICAPSWRACPATRPVATYIADKTGGDVATGEVFTGAGFGPGEEPFVTSGSLARRFRRLD